MPNNDINMTEDQYPSPASTLFSCRDPSHTLPNTTDTLMTDPARAVEEPPSDNSAPDLLQVISSTDRPLVSAELIDLHIYNPDRAARLDAMSDFFRTAMMSAEIEDGLMPLSAEDQALQAWLRSRSNPSTSNTNLRPIHMPSVHISANDLAESAAECRLAHMLYEVPIGADGVFHGEAFAASGADVEMLERDMNVTAPFMGSRN